MSVDYCDVLVIGSGSAALSAALRAARGGLSVIIAEKSELLGGTSAMSGAGIWIPANHLAREAKIDDSAEEALRYIRSASPLGWQDREDSLWQAFVGNADRMLEFLCNATPLKFELVDQADPYSECPGGKRFGRMLSPTALSRNTLGSLAGAIRRSPLPHIFTYREIYEYDLQKRPLQAVVRLWPKLLRRYLTNAGGQGTALIAGLLRGCLDAGCQVRLQMRAVRLLAEPGEATVIGAEFRDAGDRTQFVLACKGVVLATGGFEWDSGLMSQHFPGSPYVIGSSPTNTGDGQKMSVAAGAALDRMDQANVYVCYPVQKGHEGKGLPSIFHSEPHSILVNRKGRRFVSESEFNLGEAVDRRTETRAPIHLPVWLIGDARFSPNGATNSWLHTRGRGKYTAYAQTLEELAGKLGLPADTLVAEVDRFNAYCDQGRDGDFRRGETYWEGARHRATAAHLGRIEKPPFVGIPLERFMVGTKGGARTNPRGQVLRADGSIIPGLYAAGLAMANSFGSHGIGAGTTLGPSLTWGFICAESILADGRP